MYSLEWPCGRILDELYEGVYFLDTNKKIIYWNKSAELITGFSKDAALSQSSYYNLLLRADKHGKVLKDEEGPAALTLLDGQTRSAELFFRHKKGYLLAVSLKIFSLKDNDGKMIGAVCVFIDNSAREALFRELEQLRDKANLDQLTGIYNRRYGETLIATKLIEFQKGGRPVGLLFADIDHFKRVNDTYGHAVGDLVLKTVAKTLSSSVRNMDHVIRWGGEELLVLLAGDFDLNGLRRIANKLRILVEQSKVQVGGHTIQVTVSMGAALAGCNDSVDTLVNKADRLMYESKKAGRNRITAE